MRDEIDEIKSEKKGRKLNILNDEIKDQVICKFNDFKTKIYILKKTFNFEKERELRLSNKNKINKIERFKEKLNY